MIWKAVILVGVALSASCHEPAISEQHIVQHYRPEHVGHHGELAHIGPHAPKHHEEYAWSYPSYEFSYKVSDPHTHDHKGQHEVRDGDVVRGEYWLIEPDGNKRTVKYHADGKSGFHAEVHNSKHHVHLKTPHHEHKSRVPEVPVVRQEEPVHVPHIPSVPHVPRHEQKVHIENYIHHPIRHEPLKHHEPIRHEPMRLLEPVRHEPIRHLEPVRHEPIRHLEPVRHEPIKHLEPVRHEPIGHHEPVLHYPMIHHEPRILHEPRIRIEEERVHHEPRIHEPIVHHGLRHQVDHHEPRHHEHREHHEHRIQEHPRIIEEPRHNKPRINEHHEIPIYRSKVQESYGWYPSHLEHRPRYNRDDKMQREMQPIVVAELDESAQE